MRFFYRAGKYTHYVGLSWPEVKVKIPNCTYREKEEELLNQKENRRSERRKKVGGKH